MFYLSISPYPVNKNREVTVMQNATRRTLDRRSSEDTMGLVSVETNMSAPMPDLALSREDMAVWLWLVK